MENVWNQPPIWMVEQKTGQQETGRSNNSELVKGFRHVVIVGRCFGLISRNDLLTQSECKRSLAVAPIIPGILTLYYLFDSVLFIRDFLLNKQTSNVTETLWELQFPIYATIMFSVYAYLLCGSNRFKSVIQTFITSNQQFPSSPLRRGFYRFCVVASVSSLCFGILENVLFDLQIVWKAPEGVSKLEYFYKDYFSHWTVLLPYHPILAFFHILIEKGGILGWFYGDVFIIVLTRALAEKFRALNNSIQLRMKQNKDDIQWDKFRDEFLMLQDLNVKIERFITPIILGCYVNNVYLMIINLFNWITPCSDFTSEMGFWAYEFFHFFFRVSSITYFVADVHHSSRAIMETIQQCPYKKNTLSLERMEKMLANNPPGICLFDCFMITRTFFLSIISFLFSTQIVLFQTAAGFKCDTY